MEMGVGDFTGGISLLFSDGDGGECGAGLCHDWGALSGLDDGKADGSGQLVGVGLVGAPHLGPAAGGGCGVSTLISRCSGADGFGRAVAGKAIGMGEA